MPQPVGLGGILRKLTGYTTSGTTFRIMHVLRQKMRSLRKVTGNFIRNEKAKKLLDLPIVNRRHFGTSFKNSPRYLGTLCELFGVSRNRAKVPFQSMCLSYPYENFHKCRKGTNETKGNSNSGKD